MSRSRRRKKRNKAKKERKPFITRRRLLNTLLALAVAVITGAIATLIGEWAVYRWITSPHSQIALLEVGPPKQEEMAFLYMVARSPFVGWDDQGRFVIEGVDPFDLGVLSIGDLPYIDWTVRLANAGEKPTTATSFSLTFYTLPYSLGANGYPFPSDEKTVALDVGQTVDVTIRFQLAGLSKTSKVPETETLYDLEMENLETIGKLELSITDIEGGQISAYIEFKVGQTHPDHKLFAWSNTVQEAIYTGVIPMSYLESKANPALTRSYVRLGDEYYRRQLYHEAVEAFTVAIDLDSRDSDVYHKRGDAWDEIDELENAVFDYTRAIELESDKWQAFINLGYVYTKLGNYEQAEQSLQSAIAVMPEESIIPYLNLGAVYIATGRYDSAIESLTRAILLDPNAPQAYHYRSCAYMALGEEEKSRRDSEQAIRLGWSEDDYEGFEIPFTLTPTPDS